MATPVLINRDSCFLCQIEQRLMKFQPLLLLHKGKDITAFVTTKAPPSLGFSKDIERRCTLVMKRAKSLERLSRFPQSDYQADLFHYIYRCLDCLNDRCHRAFLC